MSFVFFFLGTLTLFLQVFSASWFLNSHAYQRSKYIPLSVEEHHITNISKIIQ